MRRENKDSATVTRKRGVEIQLLAPLVVGAEHGLLRLLCPATALLMAHGRNAIEVTRLHHHARFLADSSAQS